MGVWRCSLEGVEVNGEFWRGKRVLLTGHTGFKGGWLVRWLLDMGAEVHGYALAPASEPNFFTVCGLAKDLKSHTIADIRDLSTLKSSMNAARPEIIFHLAAQALVRQSYLEPVETYAVNVMGTANLLEAVRGSDSVKAVVVVTSDKCYENREWVWPYRETEALGGYDPYSSSKACAEIVTAAYRRSYLGPAGISVASARAGNVIGGGDWAKDRLVPDFLRSADAGTTLSVRSPRAVRPWQHVLEPLAGYLMLAERLATEGGEFADAWNFGPESADTLTVEGIVTRLTAAIPGTKWIAESPAGAETHEANILRLDSSRAKAKLGWAPRLSIQEAVQRTLEWHGAWKSAQNMNAVTSRQVADYVRRGT